MGTRIGVFPKRILSPPAHSSAVRALREEGYRVILVNSNPAMITMDPDLADATYVEPITP